MPPQNVPAHNRPPTFSYGDFIRARPVAHPVKSCLHSLQLSVASANFRLDRLAIKIDQGLPCANPISLVHQNFANRAARGCANRKGRAGAFHATNRDKVRGLRQ